MLISTNIHKSYNHLSNRLEILRGIDLEVKEGEVVAVVGPSGAGKSTLLHILGGLDKPDSGKVTLEGDDVYHLNDFRRTQLRNRKIGFIFQFYHLLPEFTAWENVMLPALVAKGGPSLKTSQDKAKDLLKQVGLEKRMEHKPSQLSGGEQQRVAIARSLMNDPKIVFCDEPTGNLDSASGDEILKILLRLNKEKKMTLVIVTHDEMIARLAGRVVHMRDGKLVNAEGQKT